MPTKTSAGRDFQDNLLGRMMEQNQIATIYLLNRMSLRGRIMRFDPYVILLEPLDGSPPQLVYKSSVVSISGPRMIGGGGRRPGGPPHRGGPRYPRRDEGYGGDRPYGDRSPGDRPPYGDRPYGDRPYGDRPYGDRPYGDRPQGDRPSYGDRPPYRDRPYERPQGDRPPYDPDAPRPSYEDRGSFRPPRPQGPSEG